jgi:hypothetical protein
MKKNIPGASGTNKGSVAAAWAAHSGQLADWADKHLINRRDAWGQYIPPEVRTPTKLAVTRKGTLTRKMLIRHFQGQDQGCLIGLHSISANNTCRSGLIDIDHHGRPNRRRHQANCKATIALYKRLRQLGFQPLLVSSNGQGGYHIYALFGKPVPAPMAYAFARWLIRDWQELGLDAEPEAFPMQPELKGRKRLGNWVRLPGRHHTLDFWSRVWNGKRWESGREAIDTILNTGASDPSLIPAEALSTPEPDDTVETVVSTVASAESKAKRGRTRQVRTQPETRPVAKVLARLRNVTPSGNGWSARCPAHNDRCNSLSVAEGGDGRALIFCHAGCDVVDVVEDLGLTMGDLFNRRRRRRPLRYSSKKEG